MQYPSIDRLGDAVGRCWPGSDADHKGSSAAKRLWLCVLIFAAPFCCAVSRGSTDDEEPEKSEIIVARGIQALNDGKLRESLGFFSKALDLTPQDPEALY